MVPGTAPGLGERLAGVPVPHPAGRYSSSPSNHRKHVTMMKMGPQDKPEAFVELFERVVDV